MCQSSSENGTANCPEQSGRLLRGWDICLFADANVPMNEKRRKGFRLYKAECKGDLLMRFPKAQMERITASAGEAK